jgi:transcription elongation GreA/GreB family factor
LKGRVDKAALVRQIIAQLDAELEGYARSARTAHEEATHEQSKAENKYDTRGLEASYLAHGQSRLAAATQQARQEFASLTLRDFGPDDPIDPGALVEIKRAGGRALYFIGPRAGGTEVALGKDEVLVLTPESPLGQQLIGRKMGDRWELAIGAARSECRVLSVA